MAEWQTRWIQNPVSLTLVWVQVPPPVLVDIKGLVAILLRVLFASKTANTPITLTIGLVVFVYPQYVRHEDIFDRPVGLPSHVNISLSGLVILMPHERLQGVR